MRDLNATCSSDSAKLVQVVFVLESALGLATISLYALMLRVTARNAKYATAFFTLFRWHAIVNIWCFLHSHVFLEFPTLNIFCEPLLRHFGTFSYRLTPIYFLAHYLQHVHFLLATLISVNRMSAVLMRETYEQVWTAALPYALASCFSLPLLFVWPLLFSETAVLPMHQGLALVYNKHISWISNSLATALTALTCGVLNLVSTSVLLLKLRRHRRVHCNEPQLLAVGIILGEIAVVYSIDQLAIYCQMRQDELSERVFAVLYDTRFVIATLSTLAPAWTLLLLCESLRTQLTALYAHAATLSRCKR